MICVTIRVFGTQRGKEMYRQELWDVAGVHMMYSVVIFYHMWCILYVVQVFSDGA